MAKGSFVRFVDDNIALLSRLHDEGFVTKLKRPGGGESVQTEAQEIEGLRTRNAKARQPKYYMT